MARPLNLTDEQRAEIFQGLGRALSAGLDAERALAAVTGIGDGGLDGRLKRTGSAVRKGTALPLALHRQGLLGEADMVLVAAGDQTGTVDRVFERLAARYARAAVRWRQMKGRLLLPVAILVVAIIVLPVPALAAGALTVTQYVARSASLLVILALLAWTASRLVLQWRATGTPGWLTRLARLLPGIAGMSRQHQRADACERLSMALASGLPAGDALTAMRRTEPNSVRNEALVRAHSALGGGTGVADALERAGLLDPSSYAIVSAGEAAGRLEETLARTAEDHHAALDDAYGLLAQWIPVALYLAVAGVVAVGLIG